MYIFLKTILIIDASSNANIKKKKIDFVSRVSVSSHYLENINCSIERHIKWMTNRVLFYTGIEKKNWNK